MFHPILEKTFEDNSINVVDQSYAMIYTSNHLPFIGLDYWVRRISNFTLSPLLSMIKITLVDDTICVSILSSAMHFAVSYFSFVYIPIRKNYLEFTLNFIMVKIAHKLYIFRLEQGLSIKFTFLKISLIKITILKLVSSWTL